MQSLFTAVRRLLADSTAPTTEAVPARAALGTGPQPLAADDLRHVSGGDGETAKLPVTKW